MKIDHVFPIPIARFTVDESIIKNTTDLVNKYIVDSDLTNPPAPGEILTTFYNHKDFLGKLGDKALLNYINRAAREYIQLLGYDYKCYIEITSWLQFNQPNSYFVRHDHYGAFISGCVYLQIPENSGNILYHNPLETRRVSNTFFEKIKAEENDYNFSHITYTPVVGEMIIFESWLQHTVQQNMSNENRISIGFNIVGESDAKS
jgi:uncharacterized protein (TIGR02466 family)